MNERKRQLVRQFAVSRDKHWYVDHPNSDRAAARIDAAFQVIGSPYTEWARRSRIRPGCPLTIRQLQVIGGLAGGLTYAGVGGELGISADSVKRHARVAYRKLGARRAGHAVAILMRDGWL